MGFVRLIHHSHYDPAKRRFKSLAFKTSSSEREADPGVSVIEYDCAIRVSGSVCLHVETFYPKHQSPTIFWEIPEGTIPDECRCEQIPSDSGDDCHYDIKDLADSRARRISKAIAIDQCRICDEAGNPRVLTLDDLAPQEE